MGIFGVMLGSVVAALALFALVGVFQGVMMNQRSQTALNTLTIIEATSRRTFASAPEYEPNGAVEASALSAVPDSAIIGTLTSSADNREIVTPWGSAITAGAGDFIGSDPTTCAASNNCGNRFWIQVSDVPEEACEIIASAYLNRPDVFGIDADGTFAAMTATIAAAHDTRAEILASCDDADENDLGIVFRG